MLLKLSNTKHLNTLVHEGKMLIVATVQNGSTFELYYTVKQDGFEDSALRPDSMGWEQFRKLALPNEDEDTSVLDKDKETLTDKDGKYLLRSKYKSTGLTADAPVQLVSHDGFVYLFRQSTDKTLLLDRFVLDGMTNTLNRKLEVRFKRSKQRYTPKKPAKISGGGQMNAADSLDFRDIDGKPFYEPSMEILPGILNGIQDGNFAAVVTPTEEKEVYRWHLFATLGDTVTLISLRSGDEQAFDVSDYWFREVDEDTNQATYNSIPGIIKRELDLQKNADGASLAVTEGLAAVKYDVQRLANTSAGEMLTRDTSKILLAVPTKQGIAALNFSIALNGTLAEIAPPSSVTTLRQQEREIPLPLALMDDIKAIGATKEAPGGTISAMQRSVGDVGADCVQVTTVDALDKLQVGNTVTLKDTNSFDGLYTVETAEAGAFRIKAAFNDDAMGSWEKVEEETGLVFDGILTGYSRNVDGTLTVNAVNHGLNAGDQVQIVGSPDYDGEYPVIAKDDKHFTIQRAWVEGEAVNIKAQSRKRRGLIFDGKQDCVSVPFSDPVKCTGGFTLEAWVKAESGDAQTLLHLASAGSGNSTSGVTLQFVDNQLIVDYGADSQVLPGTRSSAISSLEWTHLAAVYDPSNGAGLFNGTSGYVALPSMNPDFSQGLTIEAWVYYDELKPWSRIMDLGVAGQGSYIVLTTSETSDCLRFYVFDKKTDKSFKSDSVLVSNQWMHLAATIDKDGNATIYKSGVSIKSGKLPKVSTEERIHNYIGKSNAPADPLFKGQMRDVRLWNRARTPDEIKAGMYSCLTGTESGLVGNWILETSKNGTTPDRTGKYTGTLVGSVTIEKKACIKLFTNGIVSGIDWIAPLKLNANALVMAAKAGQTTTEGVTSNTAQYLQGEMSEVRLWDCARTSDDIADTMHLQLTGRETGLVGYWKLGGIAQEDGHQLVYDFSMNACHGLAQGSPYAGGLTLKRKLADNTTSAVKYGNDELFAVVEGAMYQERFELKLPANVDPNNVDQQQGKVFVPDLWGRFDRASAAKIPVSPISPPAFKALADGWYEFVCTFMIPEGVRLLRSFGVRDVKGNWEVIDIRRHSIKLQSDTVRLANTVERVNFKELALAPANAYSTLSSIRDKVLQEASLVTRLKWLEEKLKELQALKALQDSNDQTDLNKAKKAHDEKVAAAKAAFDTADSDYNLELNAERNYWQRIQVYHSKLYLEGGDGELKQKSESNSEFQLWRKVPVDSTINNQIFYKIVCKSSGKCLDVTNARQNSADPVGTYEYVGRWNQQWELIEKRIYGGDDYYSLHPRHSDKVLDVWWVSKEDGAVVKQGNSYPECHNQKFRFLKSDIMTDEGDTAIANAKKVRAEKENAYNAAKAEQVISNLTSAETTAKITQYQTEKDGINKVLTDLRKNIATDEKTYLDTAANSANTALVMSDAPDQHAPDDNYPDELKVQAALLTGSVPATRVQALESCTGVVALSYQDERGCLRQLQYDTAYDIDGKGEQWLAEPLSVALKRMGTNLTIPASVFKGVYNQITIEFWAKGNSPYDPDTPCWEYLASDGGSFTLDEVATVRYGTGSTWITKVLEKGTYSNFHTASVFGKDPVPSHLKTCEKRIDGVVLSAKSNDKMVLKIQLPDRDEKLVWSIGNGNVVDTIRKEVLPGLYRENWTHWAFVKDCDKGEMKIYANGRLYASNTVDIQKPETKLIQSLGGITSVVLDSSWQGAIAELRIWNEALGEREIEMNSLLALSGNEPGLVAYYRMDEAQGNEARDKTGKNPALSGVAGQWTPCTLPLNQSGAMTFDGKNNYLQLPVMNPDFSQGLTIEAWVYYDELRPWSRIMDVAGQGNYIVLTTSETNDCLRLFVFDEDTTESFKSDSALVSKQWMHLVATIDKDGNATIYKNGVSIKSGSLLKVSTKERTHNYIGKSNAPADPLFKGQMRDVRLWNCVRTPDEIKAGMYVALTGKEDKLVGNWLSLSVPRLAPVLCSEYSRMRVNAEKQKTAMMMRTVAMPSPAGVVLFDEQRIEELEMKWIGNAQIKPTLLGYIEGAPPVPTENLTLEDDYNGATSVELIQSSDVSYSWTREQDVSSGATAEVFAGMDSETFAGIGVSTSIEGIHEGFKGNLDFAYHWQNASTVSASHSLTSSDRLELRGNKETEPNFPHLGCRFIPKNIGYALVVSGLADVYISRLRRSGRMVGYQVLPTEGIPLDVNTITFMMNPAYTMAGSLDGLTGSAATSQRFFSHVPAMRNQYGALYPASYLRLTEAYHLKDQIDKQDKNHQAYFDNFNSGLVDEKSLNRQVSNTQYDGATTSMESSTSFAAQDSPEVATLDKQIEDLASKIKLLEGKPSLTTDEKTQLLLHKEDKKEAENKRQKLKQAEQDKRTQESQERQGKIAERHTDLSAKAQASTSFASWQRKMENLRIRAGKRNIVNTYVWDGDGGFHAEEQQFASTVEHSIGGSFDFAAALGYEGDFEVSKAAVSLTAQATVGLTQTMNKTEARGSAMELHVDLGGVESRGITDYKDRPLLPGEKVDRYRFMTFYLEKNTNHWHDFFTQVVDPEWLASNDEEARALRQTQLAAPNEVWRVLHRVTYVERPALMGFGRDMRALSSRPDEDDTITTLKELKAANKALETKLDGILAALASLTKK